MARVHFTVNGIPHSVGSETSSDMTLAEYVRSVAEFRGTKYNCLEAGCGACVLSVRKDSEQPPNAVNSCMVSVFSCHGWEVTTIEKIGNRLDGYHPLQTAIADHCGTQCGYCTPGFIMNMYSNLTNKKSLTMLEIEKSFGSNICRCTGYRPILDAFKTFAVDAPGGKAARALLDVEDVHVCRDTRRGCSKARNCSGDWCFLSQDDIKASSVQEIDLFDNKKWFRVNTVADITSILSVHGTSSYMLVGGNTSRGATPIDEFPKILIDISHVSELKGYSIDQNLILGSGMTLSEALETFQALSSEDGFAYLSKLYDHLQLAAHIPVRNIGTLGGNLMMKHQSNSFASDVFLLFLACDAQLTILNAHGVTQTVDMEEFLALDMTGCVIINIMLPPYSDSYTLVSFKVMVRAQAVHAVVNAAYLYKLDSSSVVEAARISYGGLSASCVRAPETEAMLVGRSLFSADTVAAALQVLDSELVVEENPPEPGADFRKRLALNLFYKGLLHICPTDSLATTYQSGAGKIHDSRPVSSGTQTYTTDSSLWPLNQPVPKLEGLIQAAGEAPYTDDLPRLPHEVYAAFVLSTVGTGKILSIDPKPALKMPGVLAFYSVNDIPGLNSFTPAGASFYPINEEVLCSGEVKYYNQPVGVVVAESKLQAERAAKHVVVKYCNVNSKPLLDIKKGKSDASKLTLTANYAATEQGTDVVKVFSGEMAIYWQFHFTMETLACVTKPTEEGMEVHSATQWLNGVQLMISRALLLDENKIDVVVRRVGGGYGFKISRSTQVAVACALVTQKLGRPCRFMPPHSINMKAMGKRAPCAVDYEVGVNSAGKIQYLNYNLYSDNGFTINESLSTFGVDVYNNCYDASRWNYTCYDAITDTAKNTWCRSPGTLENIAMAEYLMERIAYETGLDPLEVRLANLDTTNYGDLQDVIDTLKTSANYAARRTAVDTFNSENRWRKRGLRFSLLRWTPLGTTYIDITISVFHGDGTVAITHGGIEMGQGINTKAAQVAAYELGIPLSKIQIKKNESMITPNSFVSGGSFASQYVCIGIKKCCAALLEKLEPVRSTLTDPSWETLVQAAFDSDVDLQTHAFVGAADAYNSTIYGAALAEVELDVLTGESEILQVDLLQDVGQSISPQVDIGQVEGAFVMGIGYWTSEEVMYDSSGECLTTRAWHYHVPQARDIPQKFNISFRQNSYSSEVVYGSKMTGEPSICMSVVVAFALREAVAAARKDNGIPTTTWFDIDGPFTLEKINSAININTSDFQFS